MALEGGSGAAPKGGAQKRVEERARSRRRAPAYRCALTGSRRKTTSTDDFPGNFCPPLPALPRLEDDLRIETSKRATWAEENERRRTDYIPAIVALVKALGKSGKLQKLVDDAVEKQASRRDDDDD